MNKWIVALCAGALISFAGTANAQDMLSHLVLSASGDSWSIMNGQPAVRDDAEVKGGKATRVAVRKGANPWDVQATIPVPQPVAQGDILLVAYYVRVETPPEGSTTGVITQAGVQVAKAPYTALASEPSTPTGKWNVYYASGVVDVDHAKNTLVVVLHLAATNQTLDLGPIFLFNLGPNWDRSKIPHNRPVAAAAPAPAAASAGPEGPYGADLARLRTKLPVKGVLINDPAQIYSYGPDITATQVDAADVLGGKAKRIVTTKPGAHPYDDGASSPIAPAIKKGDVIFTAALVRATETPAGSQSVLIPELGVHLAGAPYTALATSSATAPKGQWTWIYASGTATADYAPGSTGFGMQLGGSAQTLDIGAVYVLNLGQGVDTSKLPNNFGK
jgi:hypothetical protein